VLCGISDFVMHGSSSSPNGASARGGLSGTSGSPGMSRGTVVAENADDEGGDAININIAPTADDGHYDSGSGNDDGNSNDDVDRDDEYNNNTPSASGPATPPEEEKSCWARFLSGVVHTNKDYGLGEFLQLPDVGADNLATNGDVELQAPTFFASQSVVRARRFI
jgi:hypothetical protein